MQRGRKQAPMSETTNTKDYEYVDRAELDNLWEIRILKPDASDRSQLRYDNGHIPNRPSFYWVDLEIWRMNGTAWEKEIEGNVKWDGCSNWQLVSNLHFCGLKDAKFLFERAVRIAAWMLNGHDMKEHFE